MELGRWVALSLFGTLVLGCQEEGHKLAATRTGDLSYALSPRTAPNTEQIAACGAPARGPLPRAPYLQQVGSSSALVLFTTRSPTAPVVDVSRPDGTEVASVTATRDESANLSGDLWQAVAELEGLEPNTLYCYQVRGVTEPTGFRTAPAKDSREPVRFIAFGDSGAGGRYQAAVRDQMFTVPFDFIVHTGDIAYDDGTLGQLEGQFFGVYRELLQNFAAFPVAGNHDYNTRGGAPMREVFALPENGAPDMLERWYSFDWGPLHVAGLDTEQMNATQAEWLDADLAATDRPWKIVIGHRPPYSSGDHGSNGKFRSVFGPLLAKHGVQLALAGHDHHYERSLPQAGTTYIVTGGGGKSTYPTGHSSFTAFAEDVHHFVQIEIHGDELFLHAIDGVGREFDSARLTLDGD